MSFFKIIFKEILVKGKQINKQRFLWITYVVFVFVVKNF